MTPLSKLLNEANTDSWSNREIARRSGISPATVDLYMKGTHGDPTEDVLQRFHATLNVSIEKLRQAAGVPSGELQPWQPPPEVNRLNRRQRQALDELIRSFVDTRGATNDAPVDSQSAKKPRAPRKARKDQEGHAGDGQQSDYELVQRKRDPRVESEIPEDEDWPADPEGPDGGA